MTDCHQVPRHFERTTRRSKNAAGTRSHSLTVEISQHIADGKRGVVLNQPALTTSSGSRGERLHSKFKYWPRQLSALNTHKPSVLPETCKANDKLIHFYLAVARGSFSCFALLRRHLSSFLYRSHATHTTRSLVGPASSREILVMASDD